LLSGVFVTWTHNEILSKKSTNNFKAIFSLFMTIILAFLFTVLQAFEYIEASFSIADSAYGSIFFMATGFHGFHVIIGTLFLAVCLVRLIQYHFTRNHHLGLEFAI
jgi:cytochrome c oxidase subunit 3